LSYRVQKKNHKFHVVEKDTEQIIETYNTRDEAKDTVRSLNLGSGFNGFTPAFFTEKWNVD